MKKYVEGSSYNFRERESKKPSAKKLDHIRVHHAENGGHLVEHHFEAPDGYMGRIHEPEKHSFGPEDHHEMIHHVAKHMGAPRALLLHIAAFKPEGAEEEGEPKRSAKAEEKEEAAEEE